MKEIADVFYCSVGLICCVTWVSILIWKILQWAVGQWHTKRRGK